MNEPGDTTPQPTYGEPSQPSYGAPQPPAPPSWRPYAQGPALPPPAPKRNRRLAFAGSVVAASLLVGGAAGIGGAAAYSALDDDASGASGGSTSVQTSKVVDTPTSSASPGSVQAVAQEVLPSVVKIEVSGAEGSGSGSGIILSSDGKILTNNHVVEVAGDGGTMTVAFNDGTKASATILGTDPLTDTAVIQAQDVSGLTPATIGKSGDLQVGQGVVAIGSPFGLESTVTSGIVSALDRPVDVGSDEAGNATVYPAIQTDAAINPGNSGGALTDLNGRVVGINASIRTAGSSSGGESGSIGLGFAIPIDQAERIGDQLAQQGFATQAVMGIGVGQAQQGVAENGATISTVTPGGPAAAAGLQPGDVVTRVNDRVIDDGDSLVAAIRTQEPGAQVTLTVQSQGGAERQVPVTLGTERAPSS